MDSVSPLLNRALPLVILVASSAPIVKKVACLVGTGNRVLNEAQWSDEQCPVDVVLLDFDSTSAEAIISDVRKVSTPLCIALVQTYDVQQVTQCERLGIQEIVFIESDLDNDRLPFIISCYSVKPTLTGSIESQIKAPSPPVSNVSHQGCLGSVAEHELLYTRHALLLESNSLSASWRISMDIDELVEQIALHTQRLCDAQFASVSLLNEAESHLVMRGVAGCYYAQRGFIHKKNQGVVGSAWSRERTLYITDYSGYKKQIEQWHGIEQCAAIPLLAQGRVIGVLGLILDKGNDTLLQHMEIVQLFADAAAKAVDACISIDKQKQALRQYQTLSEITRVMYTAKTTVTLIDTVSASLLTLFNAKHILSCKLNDDGQLLQIADWQNQDGSIRRLQLSHSKLINHSSFSWALQQRVTAITLEGALDERDSKEMQKMRSLLGMGATITLPLIQHTHVWGGVQLSRAVQQPDFSEQEVILLELIAEYLSSALMQQELLDDIQYQAFHDSLTGLPNRVQFELNLKRIADTANRDEVALLFIDLDGFKGINDSRGHSVGDKLLIQVSKRLSGCLQESDLLARMGGDEFAVLLRGVNSKNNALKIAERLKESINQAFVIEGSKVNIGTSIGVSFYSKECESIEDLVRNADYAMYEAKASGKNAVYSFQQKMAEYYSKKRELETDLLSAIHSDQLELHYQPIIDLNKLSVVGFEAFVRWNHPKYGQLKPRDFFPIAYSSERVIPIGNWVLEEAARQLAFWRQKNDHDLFMSINLFGQQLALVEFVDLVKRVIAEYDLPAHCLSFEVSESVIMKNFDEVEDIVTTLRELGISLSIDDFGVGYSSIRVLGELPVDCLKIDAVFVDKLSRADAEFSSVNAIVMLSKSFGLKSVAEGVETEEQLRCLKALGCDYAQGFYYAKPMSNFVATDFLSDLNDKLSLLKQVG